MGLFKSGKVAAAIVVISRFLAPASTADDYDNLLRRRCEA
jgi:hypothetical protein